MLNPKSIYYFIVKYIIISQADFIPHFIINEVEIKYTERKIYCENTISRLGLLWQN